MHGIATLIRKELFLKSKADLGIIWPFVNNFDIISLVEIKIGAPDADWFPGCEIVPAQKCSDSS